MLKKELKAKLNKCKNCGNEFIIIDTFCEKVFALCTNCKDTTADCTTVEEAVREWNIRNSVFDVRFMKYSN
jgi:hypothetical protein